MQIQLGASGRLSALAPLQWLVNVRQPRVCCETVSHFCLNFPPFHLSTFHKMMDFGSVGFDFDHFIERRYASTRSANFNFEPIPLLPDDVPPEIRKHVEAIVGSIDVVSVRALLLRAVIDHERHIGKLVSVHCETFSKTSGRLWKCRDETHKFAGDINHAVDTLDILMVERLLVDAVLTFRNVASRVSAESKRRSRQMHVALADIQYHHDLCRAMVRELSQEWRGNRRNRGGLAQSPLPGAHLSYGAASEIASSLSKLPLIMQSVPCWETRRNTMLTYQRIADTLVNELLSCEESFWRSLLLPLMLHTSCCMTSEERKRYVHEGFYYGLLKLCPFLPMGDANALYRQFPVGSEMIERSRAEELAMAIRKLELRRRQAASLVRQAPRLPGPPIRINKTSKRRRRSDGRAAVRIKVE
ncbi:uncharacterized protein LY89DRAFT_720906 [Mollisia scopiformis]|uniref:Uncharacterized protein n=1 Tax=Mollisia scopiformis TaxID=149040 RepID=A0A194X118_MOLSC|nr:uncharacterized protein LY89DRAFT_720906 [Mollisia scopiformis]KUJ13664.1 hypothetical protein LY89DRAFT_720906 [Mollisia scopiformis]